MCPVGLDAWRIGLRPRAIGDCDVDDNAKVMIRTNGGEWRAPSVSSYPNERELQQILMDAPRLIPGVDSRAVVVDELSLPGAGYLDLLAVEHDGALTLVECKLAANAEVRRAVVGQISSYAARLWQMTFEELDEAFRTRSRIGLVDAVSEVANDEEWDSENFRQSVATRLSEGRFRLVIAVDSITDELKRIVEYLNTHTSASVEILAVEMAYVAEGGTEILLPVTHGAESVRLKTTSSGPKQKWTVEDVFSHLDGVCPPEVTATLRTFEEFLHSHGRHWQPGTSSYPTMSAYLKIGPEEAIRSVVAVYTGGSREPRLTLNFGSLAKNLSVDQLEAMLALLETAEPLAKHLQQVRAEEFDTYPGIPLVDFAAADGGALLARALAPHVGQGS